jgi:hypothetical protein
VETLGETKVMRSEHQLKYVLSHLALRVIVCFNIADTLLEAWWPTYFRMKKTIFPTGADLTWMMASSFLLPAYVGFETWWMHRAQPPQTRALLIDWVLAGFWFVLWWVLMFYSWYLYYPNL